MIVKDALVDEFEDEELEDNVDVEAPGGKSTANLKGKDNGIESHYTFRIFQHFIYLSF